MKTKIKICKIQDVVTARFCAENDVDFMGLHQIEAPIPEERISLFREIQSVAGTSKLVLVTQENKNDLNDLLDMCLAFTFDYIQMHFPLSVSDLKDFKNRLRRRGCKSGLIAVVSVADIEVIDIQTLSKEVDYILFDTSYRGGTGKCCSDDILMKIIDKTKGVKYFLAGGLNPNNVAEKIGLTNPFAVDVQSGVEVEVNGEKVKDHDKILSFINEVRK